MSGFELQVLTDGTTPDTESRIRMGALPATALGPGECGGKAADNHQDGTESEPNQCDLADGSEMLRQGQHETQEAELGEGDANSDNGFVRYHWSSRLARFLRGIHGEIGR